MACWVRVNNTGSGSFPGGGWRRNAKTLHNSVPAPNLALDGPIDLYPADCFRIAFGLEYFNAGFPGHTVPAVHAVLQSTPPKYADFSKKSCVTQRKI